MMRFLIQVKNCFKKQKISYNDLSYIIATQLSITLSLIASGVLCYKSRRGLQAMQATRPAYSENTNIV